MLTDESRNQKISKLGLLADGLGCTLSQLALGWCLLNPRVSSVITGASRPEQVKENMQALRIAPQLTADVVQGIETIMANNPNQ
jgi:aryl-alcohol dehydrogenase-like predicted oxidoreductase